MHLKHLQKIHEKHLKTIAKHMQDPDEHLQQTYETPETT
jgi:hypothetical protein